MTRYFLKYTYETTNSTTISRNDFIDSESLTDSNSLNILKTKILEKLNKTAIGKPRGYTLVIDFITRVEAL